MYLPGRHTERHADMRKDTRNRHILLVAHVFGSASNQLLRLWRTKKQTCVNMLQTKKGEKTVAYNVSRFDSSGSFDRVGEREKEREKERERERERERRRRRVPKMQANTALLLPNRTIMKNTLISDNEILVLEDDADTTTTGRVAR